MNDPWWQEVGAVVFLFSYFNIRGHIYSMIVFIFVQL